VLERPVEEGPREDSAPNGATQRAGRTKVETATATWTNRVAERIPAGAIRTSPATSCGCRSASRRPTSPPNEWPTISARPHPASRIASATASANQATSAPRGGLGEPP
jgi:hypothetical protein